MSREVLWDSSAILALLDSRDAAHRQAVRVAETLAAEARPGFVTHHVEVETHALLLRRLGRAAARDWLFSRSLPVVRTDARHEEKARQILLARPDKDWSLCDAISFAVMEARQTRTAFSFDRHFVQYGRFTVLGPG